MTQRIFIRPAPLELEGKPTPRLVRKRNGAPLKAEGEFVTLDTFWRRRINDGDVEVVEPQPVEGEGTAAEVVAVAVGSDTSAGAGGSSTHVGELVTTGGGAGGTAQGAEAATKASTKSK